jgi:ABC-type Fe3+-hydroxamate transport system substrate-binding protein
MKKVFLAGAALTILMLMLFASACKSSSTTTTATSPVISPGNGEVINSDSIDTVQIVDVNARSTGYPWQLDVVIDSTGNVGILFNPVALNVGDVVSVVTDQDMSMFNANDIVKAKIKYTGDVNIQGGIRLYLYNVAPQVSP